MEVNLIGAVIGDVYSEFEGKKSRHLIVLSGEGKSLGIKKVKVPIDFRNVEVQTFVQTEIPGVEMNEWSMNGKSGVSFSLKNPE